MALRAETLDFLHELERSSNRKLNYATDVGHLLEAARRSEKMSDFEEAIFLAKFVTKSIGVMKRIGADGEGYDKLSAEFKASLEKSSSLLKDVGANAPDEIRRSEETLFFSMTQESLERLVKLMEDLASVKNWLLDGKSLP